MPLFVVATPIGNLSDISRRAGEVLAEADVVFAEDTRHSRKLFAALAIQTTLRPYHEHSDQKARDEILRLLEQGRKVAIITDAGTPCISDPGYRLVRAAAAAGHRVEPVPGASAPIAFLSAAGLPTDSFTFVGFLPSKAVARGARLKELMKLPNTVVCFESPGRLAAALAQIAEIDPAREVVVGREITKLHEEFVRGEAAVVSQELSGRGAARGECVIGFAGAREAAPATDADVARLAAALVDAGVRTRAASKVLAKMCGLSASDAYAIMLGAADE